MLRNCRSTSPLSGYHLIIGELDISTNQLEIKGLVPFIDKKDMNRTVLLLSLYYFQHERLSRIHPALSLSDIQIIKKYLGFLNNGLKGLYGIVSIFSGRADNWYVVVNFLVLQDKETPQRQFSD